MSNATSETTRRSRRVRVWLALVVVLAAVGFLLAQGLGNASIYFYPADEAMVAHEQLGTDRFRLMGDVEAGTVKTQGDQVLFAVAYNGAQIDVTHTGDPPELFREGIRVVLEGSFTGPKSFSSDKILVKHSETYREENKDRFDNESDYRDPGTNGSVSGPNSLVSVATDSEISS